MPARSLVERAAYKLLRSMSPRFKAHTELLEEPYCDWVPWHSGLGRAAFALYGLARARRPGVIVEIGSARGRSTCIFALACAQSQWGHVYAIDPHIVNEWTDIHTQGSTERFLRERLREYRLAEYCDVITATSVEAAKNWSTRIDLLFIDGDHSYAGVRHDFEAFSPWLAPDALVLFHDSSWEHEGAWERFASEPWYRSEMGVPRYLDELSAAGYRSVTLPEVPGLTILDPSPSGFDFLAGTRAR